MPKPSSIPDLERRYGKPIKAIIANTLNETDGNVTEAAKSIGVPVGTLAHWMYRFQIKRRFVPIVS